MIWDMETVNAVRYHVAEGEIDLSIKGEAGLGPLFDRLYEELNRTITSHYGAVVDKADCHATKVNESHTFNTETYRMYWDPRDRPGEIMGGPHDGTATPAPDAIGTYYADLQLPNDDPRFASMRTSDPLTGEHPIITHTNRYTTYSVTGWSDLHRCWIYTKKETR